MRTILKLWILFLRLGAVPISLLLAAPGWTPQDSETVEHLTGVSFVDANTGTVVGQRGTILRTTDGGATWQSQNSRTRRHLWGVSFTDANTGTVVGDTGTILRTTTGGEDTP